MDNNNYYQEIIVKIKKNINEKKWQKALNLVQQELQVSYVPRDYQQEFEILQSEILTNLNQIKENDLEASNFWTLEMISKVINDSSDEDKHNLAFYYLQNYNVRLILPVITNYLLNPENNNINKTRLIELLKNQNINQEFKVVKTHGTFLINPTKFIVWYNLKVYKNINQLLEKKVYFNNPMLYEICFFLLNNYFESLMPKIPNLKHVNAIAAAIYIRACSFQFIKVTLLLSAKMFHSTSVLIKKYLSDLNQHKIT